MSNEGFTQGDVTFMALYALGIEPLIDNLKNTVILTIVPNIGMLMIVQQQGNCSKSKSGGII